MTRRIRDCRLCRRRFVAYSHRQDACQSCCEEVTASPRTTTTTGTATAPSSFGSGSGKRPRHFNNELLLLLPLAHLPQPSLHGGSPISSLSSTSQQYRTCELAQQKKKKTKERMSRTTDAMPMEEAPTGESDNVTAVCLLDSSSSENNNDDQNDDDQVDEFSQDDGGGSEGGDDFHCTQIAAEENDDDDNDDEEAEKKSAHEKEGIDEDDDDDDDVPLFQFAQRHVISQSNTNEQTFVKQRGEELQHGQNCSLGGEPLPGKIKKANEAESSSTSLSSAQGKDAETHETPTTSFWEDAQHDDPDIQIEFAQAAPEDQQENNDLRICSVCGASLEHILTWTGRMNHLKRCSKEYGILARDVRLHRPEDENDDVLCRASNHNNAGDEKKKRFWHDGASSDLAEASKQRAQQLQQEQAKPTCANDLLMAGARRKAKLDKQRQAAKEANAAAWRKNRWGPKRNYGSLPAYKKISGTDFVVDGFYYAKSSLTQNYFLTHFHSDHYGGITKSWDAGIIYCTLPTANLVNQQLGVDRKFLHPLPLRTPVQVASQGRLITVTLWDANHCPGAAIMLFEIGKGPSRRRILHVGDFRWNRNVMLGSESPLLPIATGQFRLDELFLDTTYCDPKYTLPSQDDAIEATVKAAVDEIERAKKTRQRILMLFGAYTIGKERIYLAVAKRLGMKVYVDRRRYRILSALEWSQDELSIFTCHPEDSCLWVVPLGHIGMKKLPSYQSVNIGKFSRTFDRVVGFRPTGWSMSSKGNGLVKPCTRGNVTSFSVPYSEHSSFHELLDCLRALKPRKIVPTVSVSKSEQQIEVLMNHLRLGTVSDI